MHIHKVHSYAILRFFVLRSAEKRVRDKFHIFILLKRNVCTKHTHSHASKYSKMKSKLFRFRLSYLHLNPLIFSFENASGNISFSPCSRLMAFLLPSSSKYNPVVARVMNKFISARANSISHFWLLLYCVVSVFLRWCIQSINPKVIISRGAYKILKKKRFSEFISRRTWGRTEKFYFHFFEKKGCHSCSKQRLFMWLQFQAYRTWTICFIHAQKTIWNKTIVEKKWR